MTARSPETASSETAAIALGLRKERDPSTGERRPAAPFKQRADEFLLPIESLRRVEEMLDTLTSMPSGSARQTELELHHQPLESAKDYAVPM